MNPIRIIDWKLRFMPEFARFLIDRTGDRLQDALVVFPHNRPKRYLRAALAENPDLPKPLVLPEMVSFTELAPLAGRTKAVQAGLLDRTALLFDTVQSVRETTSGLLSRLPMDHERFFPWGVRLAAVFEEFLRQGTTPANMAHMQGEVVDWAAALLEHLGLLFSEYLAALEARSMTTPGLQWSSMALDPSPIIKAVSGRPVFIAGFYALSGAEDSVFRALHEQAGAEIIWHSSPDLDDRSSAGQAVVEHRKWKKRWNTAVETIALAPEDTASEIRFCEGFDLHSQLLELKEELSAPALDGPRAVVLPDTSLLMPVLHHLPETDINISMGYPLARTSLARLLEIIADLQSNRSESGEYRRRDLIGLIRHPWLKMLSPDGENTLSPVCRQWEQHIREGGAYLSPDAFHPIYDEDVSQADADAMENLRRNVINGFIRRFEAPGSLAGLCDALRNAIGLLEHCGAALWRTHLLDAECLVRLKQSVLPDLANSELSSAPLSVSTLFTVFRELLRAQRVSFEPEPLTGLQILGMLETRLLDFETLFILDAVEDKLPGTNPHDPLLPDPMRSLLGLPDSIERDNVAAYNFHRLIQGTRRTVILYQSGIKPGLFDSKSMRSRYVEQLLWDKEKKLGRVIKPGGEHLKAVQFPMSSAPRTCTPVAVTPTIRTALMKRLSTKNLSPSMLDVYLKCPKKFFFRALSGLIPAPGIDEEGDRGALGTLVHNVLEEFFTPYLNTPMDFSELDPELPAGNYVSRLRSDPEFTALGFDRLRALESAGRERLARFMSKQGRTEIIALETPAETMVEAGGIQVRFGGKLDRVDKRDGKICVLDYKTGSILTPAKKAWEDELWTKLEDSAPDPELTARLAAHFPSLQMPAYIFLYASMQGNAPPHNAGWIDLAGDGGEVLLFPDKMDEKERHDAAVVKTPAMIRYLIRAMLESEKFMPVTGRHCAWCDWFEACKA